MQSNASPVISIRALRERIKLLSAKKFVRDYFVLQGGSFLSLGLTILASVVYARILASDLYGRYALIFSLAAFLGIFTDIGLTPALTTLLARAYALKDREAIADLFAYYFKASLYFGVGVRAILVVLAPFIGMFFYGDVLLGVYTAVVLMADAAGFLFGSLVLTLQMIRNITVLAAVENLQKILTKALPAFFVLVSLRLWGVVLGYLVSILALALFAVWCYERIRRQDPLIPSCAVIRARWRAVPLSRHFSFGFLIALEKNMAKLSNTIPTLFTGLFLSPSAVGFFRIAFAYITSPAYLLTPISRLLNMQLPKSEIVSRSVFIRHFYQTTAVAFLIAAPLVIALFFAAPVLIPFFYGTDFTTSVRIARPLALLAVLMSFGVGFSALYRTLNKVRAALYLNGGVALAMVTVSYFLIKEYSLKGTVISVILWQLTPMAGTYFLALRYFFPRKER